MIYTSYFAKIRALPDAIVPISISLKPPDTYKGLEFKTLAPSPDILWEWKRRPDTVRYERRFFNEILRFLLPDNIVKKLYELSEGKDVALICYEKPVDFCHRHLVARWLNEHGYECKEWEDPKKIDTPEAEQIRFY